MKRSSRLSRSACRARRSAELDGAELATAGGGFTESITTIFSVVVSCVATTVD